MTCTHTAMQEGRRVVVTGMGIVSCLGNTLEDVSKSLHTCTPGITFSEKYEEIGMKSKVRGRPDINVDEYIDRKQARFMGGEQAAEVHAFVAKGGGGEGGRCWLHAKRACGGGVVLACLGREGLHVCARAMCWGW